MLFFCPYMQNSCLGRDLDGVSRGGLSVRAVIRSFFIYSCTTFGDSSEIRLARAQLDTGLPALGGWQRNRTGFALISA